MAAERTLILVADDDEDIVRFIEVNLRLEGFEVVAAFDGEGALRGARDNRPDLVLLDVMMPGLDGFEVCQRLRTDPATSHISVIMLTAKSLSADKVVGLTAGADDYIIKPFDPIELIARVKSALRRSREMRAVNPLTQLPGNVQVQEELARRIGSLDRFALMYIDIDNLKPFNDHYGFVRGDEVIKLLAECVVKSVAQHVPNGSFVGHVGGDDFVAIVPPEESEAAARDICDCWDASVTSLYDDEDARRGFISLSDRRKEVHEFPVMTVSIGVAGNAARSVQSHWEAAEIANEMKQFAKQGTGSTYAIDRRKPEEG